MKERFETKSEMLSLFIEVWFEFSDKLEDYDYDNIKSDVDYNFEINNNTNSIYFSLCDCYDYESNYKDRINKIFEKYNLYK